MSDLKWNWAYYPYLDPPEKQKESAQKAGYVKVVNKSDADKVIAELEEKLDGMKWSRDEWARAANDKEKQIVELKEENRKLKRELWLARALKANAEQSWSAYIKYVHVHEKSFYVFDGDDIFCRYNRNNDSFKGWYHRWMSVERKCRAKAKEYE